MSAVEKGLLSSVSQFNTVILVTFQQCNNVEFTKLVHDILRQSKRKLLVSYFHFIPVYLCDPHCDAFVAHMPLSHCVTLPPVGVDVEVWKVW